MGISIHYSGSFNRDKSLNCMINEVKDIAEVNKWKYDVYEKEFPENHD